MRFPDISDAPAGLQPAERRANDDLDPVTKPAAIPPPPPPDIVPRGGAFLVVGTAVALLDLHVILLVWPITGKLAAWAGVPLLKADYIGMYATALSIPIVIASTAAVWGRAARRGRQANRCRKPTDTVK